VEKRLFEGNRGNPWGLLYKCAVKRKATALVGHINEETLSWDKSVETILDYMVRTDNPCKDLQSNPK
jgi:hypothetical protein